jgi:hypothetical protein
MMTEEMKRKERRAGTLFFSPKYMTRHMTSYSFATLAYQLWSSISPVSKSTWRRLISGIILLFYT